MAIEKKREIPNQAIRLLEALHAQQSELGSIATELISLLQAAGLGHPETRHPHSGKTSS